MRTLREFFANLPYFSAKREQSLKVVYVALAFLSFHWSLITYMNASFLGTFMSDTYVSLLFVLGSALLLFPFFWMPRFLRALGNYRLTLLLTVLEFCAVLGMAFATSAFFASLFFLMHFVLVPLILFNIDVFVEGILGSYEAQTGSTRGLYLAILSLAGAIAPLFMGALLSQDSHTSFAPVYIASALFLIPFLWVILVYFKDFKDSPYAGFTLRTGTRLLTKNQSMRYIFIVQLHLHFFFMWTSIYIPLYLAHAAGFTWAEIGYIIAAGLSAYVLFEYPIGIAADKLIGEKEMMAAGFFLLAISCASFAFLPAGALGLWIAAMFLSRIGASLVEATSESYFFKRTQSDDTDRISLFRTARPIASILGALAGSFALLYMEFNLLFIVLALTMISGLCFTALLRDQKALWEQ